MAQINLISSSTSPSLTQPCTTYRLTLNFDVSIDYYQLEGQFIGYPVNSNTFTVVLERGFWNSIRVFKAGYSTRLLAFSPVPLLQSVISISVNNAPEGATAIINIVTPPMNAELQCEYSLNGTNWQSSNVFTGLAVDNYVAYVRDNLGCQAQKPFTVYEFNPTNPYFLISKEMSLRFILPSNEYYSDESRSYCGSINPMKYSYVQKFLNNDVITIQFKSNFNTINILLSDGENIFPISANKLSNNINLKQKLSQAKKYRVNNNQFGIYFTDGNVLDYDTNQVIESYSLNGTLPIWAKIGNFINVENVWYQISNIGFDEDKNAEVILINDTFNSDQILNVTVASIYHLQNYEVFEFTLDFNFYQNKTLKLTIANDDPNFGNYEVVSEKFQTVENLENHLEIKYLNSVNTAVVYSTGIQNLMRVEYNNVKANDSQTNDNYKTDSNAFLIDSKIYECTDFEFMPLPLELCRKLMIALSMDTVYIDNVGYTKNSEFTVEVLGNTNLYELKASMVKNGMTFNSNLNDEEVLIDLGDGVIPGLIESNNNGYINY
ncbi:hypothetical protein [Paenimyroides ceti]